MTKRKQQLEKNPPAAFAAAFKNIGGIAALAKWARSSGANRAAFYALYSKLFPVEMKSEVNAKVTVEDDRREGEQLITTMTDALARITQSRRDEAARSGLVTVLGITYRKQEDGSLVPTDERLPHGASITDNSTGITIDADTGEVIRDVGPPIEHELQIERAVERDYHRIIDGPKVAAPASPATPQSPAVPQSPAAQQPQPPPPPRSTPHRSEPSVPGLGTGAINEGSSDWDKRSTTQKFLDYNGGVFGDGK